MMPMLFYNTEVMCCSCFDFVVFLKIPTNQFHSISLVFFYNRLSFEHGIIPTPACAIVIEDNLVGCGGLKWLSVVGNVFNTVSDWVGYMNGIFNTFPHVIIIMLWFWLNKCRIDCYVIVIIQCKVCGCSFQRSFNVFAGQFQYNECVREHIITYHITHGNN